MIDFHFYANKRLNIIGKHDCGKYHHFCVITHHRSVFNVLAFGYNKYTIIDTKLCRSTHSEVMAINNLRFTKKLKKIDIYVLRVNRSGSLCNSKPCSNCIDYMRKTLRKRNYKLQNIIYTTSTDEIICTTLNKI